MVVLEHDQIERMANIMDVILKYPGLTVGDIKKKYHLTSEEYDMIFDLTMPLIREMNVKRYWASKYRHLVTKIKEYFALPDMSMPYFKKKILMYIDDPSTNEPSMYEATGLDGEENEEKE